MGGYSTHFFIIYYLLDFFFYTNILRFSKMESFLNSSVCDESIESLAIDVYSFLEGQKDIIIDNIYEGILNRFSSIFERANTLAIENSRLNENLNDRVNLINEIDINYRKKLVELAAIRNEKCEVEEAYDDLKQSHDELNNKLNVLTTKVRTLETRSSREACNMYTQSIQASLICCSTQTETAVLVDKQTQIVTKPVEQRVRTPATLLDENVNNPDLILNPNPECLNETLSLRDELLLADGLIVEGQGGRKEKGLRCTNRVQIFGGSQGRGVAGLVKDLGVKEVTGTVMPGGKAREVLAGVVTACKDFQKEDCVVLVTGTNDVAQGQNAPLLESLRRTLRGLNKTRVVLCTVPKRHDEDRASSSNRMVEQTNEEIRNLCKDMASVRILDLAAFGRGCYTKHGFHLNQVGKRRIAEVVASELRRQL